MLHVLNQNYPESRYSLFMYRTFLRLNNNIIQRLYLLFWIHPEVVGLKVIFKKKKWKKKNPY